MQFLRLGKKVERLWKTFGNFSWSWVYRFVYYAVCYAIHHGKTEKVDQYDNFQNEIEADLYEKLLGLKGNPHLKLDNDRFEEQCFEIRF